MKDVQIRDCNYRLVTEMEEICDALLVDGPMDVFERIINEKNRMTSSIEFWQDKNKWLREGLILHSYGQYVGAERIYLAPPSMPEADGFITRGNTRTAVQISEVVARGRKRHKEYKEAETCGKKVEPIENCDLASAIEDLGSRIECKLRAISLDVDLAIYLNVQGTMYCSEADIRRHVSSSISKYSESQRRIAVWVLRRYWLTNYGS
ncbi:hypothetical protein [Prosthecomicrobium sp. N25]|uniref:hypothetical protein n=1 Tax=Prosthecomicrobium sp. N25 TaxID=3129254 RepID=UPI003076A145